MATATNTTEGQILLSGDLTGTGENPELRASGVVPRTYNTSIGLPNSTGVSVGTVPKFVVDSKGRIVYASNVSGNLQFQVANSTTNGLVKVDGTTVTVSGGVLTSTLSNPPLATSSTNGAVKGGGGIPTGIVFDDPGEPNYPVFAVATMRSDRRGMWKPDRTTINIDNSGIASTIRAKATSSTLGYVKPNNTTIQIDSNGIIRANLNLATSSTAGAIKPDNVTTSVNGSGVLSLIGNLPVATSSTTGAVKPDNNTILINGTGTLSFDLANSSDKGIIQIDTNDFEMDSSITHKLKLRSEYSSAQYITWYKTNNSNRNLVNISSTSNALGYDASGTNPITNYIHIHLTATGAAINSFYTSGGLDFGGAEFLVSITKDAGVSSSTSLSSIFIAPNFKMDVFNPSFSLSDTLFAKMIVMSNYSGGFIGLLYNTQIT